MRDTRLDWDSHWGRDCYRVEYYDKQGAWVGRTWHTFFVLAILHCLRWLFFGFKTSETEQDLDF